MFPRATGLVKEESQQVNKTGTLRNVGMEAEGKR